MDLSLQKFQFRLEFFLRQDLLCLLVGVPVFQELDGNGNERHRIRDDKHLDDLRKMQERVVQRLRVVKGIQDVVGHVALGQPDDKRSNQEPAEKTPVFTGQEVSGEKEIQCKIGERHSSGEVDGLFQKSLLIVISKASVKSAIEHDVRYPEQHMLEDTVPEEPIEFSFQLYRFYPTPWLDADTNDGSAKID